MSYANPFSEMAARMAASWAQHARDLHAATQPRGTEPEDSPMPPAGAPHDPASDLTAWGPQALLRMAIAQGLKESDAREIFAEQRSALKAAYLAVAQETRHAAGDVEVDDDAAVSFQARRGAYVQAWVWVDIDELPVPETLPEALARLNENGIHCDVLINGDAAGPLEVRALGQCTANRCDDHGRLWQITDGRLVALVLRD